MVRKAREKAASVLAAQEERRTSVVSVQESSLNDPRSDDRKTPAFKEANSVFAAPGDDSGGSVATRLRPPILSPRPLCPLLATTTTTTTTTINLFHLRSDLP